jgi:hypothetical protein
MDMEEAQRAAEEKAEQLRIQAEKALKQQEEEEIFFNPGVVCLLTSKLHLRVTLPLTSPMLISSIPHTS